MSNLMQSRDPTELRLSLRGESVGSVSVSTMQFIVVISVSTAQLLVIISVSAAQVMAISQEGV